MADVQQLQIEIQKLKEALDVSEKKADRYSQLVTKVYDELDKLRSNICHDCKKRLVPGNVSASPGLSVPTTITSTSTPFWRRMLQGRLLSRRAVDNAGSGPTPNSAISSSTVSTISDAASDAPEFSVEYNPEVKRALDLHLEHVFKHEYPAWCVKISPDGQRMAVGYAESGETIINEVKTRSKVRVFVDRYVKDLVLIWSVKFSPDGRLLATAGNDDQIRIWDITQNRMRAMFKRHDDEVNIIAFSPDGRSLVSGSDDYSVCIWNIRDGSSKELPMAAGAIVVSVVFRPDGRYIAAGDLTNSLWIWDSRTHRLVANWEGHSDPVWCVAFTPDGKGLISGSMDKTFKYWDVSSLGTHEAVSGRHVVASECSFPFIRSFSGHTGRVRSIAFFPRNTEWVLTSSDDNSVRVWDIRTGVWQLTVQGHRGSVMGVDISGTENFFVTASTDCQATLWRYEVP